MKKIIKNIRLIKIEEVNFIWFTWYNDKKYCFVWEVNFTDIWWKPRYIKEKHITHFGWLFFQIGYGEGDN